MWMPALESFQNSFPSFCQLLLVTIIEKVQEYEAQGQTTTDFESFLQGGEPQTKDSKSSVHSQLVTLGNFHFISISISTQIQFKYFVIFI